MSVYNGVINMKKLLKKYNKLPLEVKASLWFFICAFLQKGISTITTPIFTRLLNVEEYGQFNIFMSWMSIISVIITLNLFSGVYVSGLVKYEERNKEFSSSLQGLCLTLVLGWLVVYLLFKDFFNEVLSLSTFEVLSMIILIWTSAVFQFWSTEQRVNLRYKSLVVITLIVSFLKPSIGIILVLISDNKVHARIIGLVFVELVFYLWMFVSQINKGRVFYDKTIWKYALSFNIPLIPHYLSTMILNSSDRLMIKRYVGIGEAGIYSLAYTISLVMLMFNQALYQTLEPWILKRIKQKKVGEISSAVYPAMFIIAIVNIIMIAVAPEVVKIFAPKEYYEAILVIPPIIMSVYFLFCPICFSVFAFYYKETKMIAIATTVAAALNIVLNCIFLPRFGYFAAGYTTLFSYIVYMVMHYIFMNCVCKKYINGVKPYNIKILICLSVAFVGIGFVFLAIYAQIIIRYLLLIVLSIIIICFRKRIKELFIAYKNLRNEAKL